MVFMSDRQPHQVVQQRHSIVTALSSLRSVSPIRHFTPVVRFCLFARAFGQFFVEVGAEEHEEFEGVVLHEGSGTVAHEEFDAVPHVGVRTEEVGALGSALGFTEGREKRSGGSLAQLRERSDGEEQLHAGVEEAGVARVKEAYDLSVCVSHMLHSLFS